MSQGLINLSHYTKSHRVTGDLHTLNDAFTKGKKDRQVLSKQIIWESGVSKSQFYRILSGKEQPSPETKIRIAKSLNIDTVEFDRLHAQSDLPPVDPNISPAVDPDVSAAQEILPRKLLLLIFVLLIGAVMALLFNQKPANGHLDQNVAVEPNDTTLFIKDVTIPDGTSIPVDTTFVKTWRVQNTGTIVWKNRYLKRITPHSRQICSSPAMVPIPETPPGEMVDISVTFTTPHLPGSCRTDWKSSDENGNLHFPEKHGLFSIVNVTQ